MIRETDGHLVVAWWEAKVAEIYTLIPDFAGLVLKAASAAPMPTRRTCWREPSSRTAG